MNYNLKIEGNFLVVYKGSDVVFNYPQKSLTYVILNNSVLRLILLNIHDEYTLVGKGEVDFNTSGMLNDGIPFADINEIRTFLNNNLSFKNGGGAGNNDPSSSLIVDWEGLGTRKIGFENTAADSYYFEQVVSGRSPSFNSDFKLKFGAEDILKIFRGRLIEIYKEITLNGGSFFVHNATEFRNENTRFNNGFRIGSPGSYMKVEAPVTTNRTATFQDKDGTIAYLSDITAPNRTIDDPNTQTSASLNSAFPFAENPVGTTVTNLNPLQLFIYVRISELLWRVITLGTTI